MGRKSKLSRLPTEVQAYIESKLREGRLTLDELIADLHLRFPAQAQDGSLPRRATVHRYRQDIEEQLAAVRDSTQAATMFYDAFPDHEDKRSAAVISMIQTQFFDAMVQMKKATADGVDPADRLVLLGKVSKSMASLVNSSVGLKQYQAKVLERTQEAVANVEKIAKKGGLSAEASAELRREILGIAA